ncbi:MAG: riboflavin synthase [Hyphomicrobiales bacterium]|nr:riboflavin synthase [Hyphomicrobiales bacterium]
MFTGIVTDVGEVIAREDRGALARMRIACRYEADGIALGASISCAGICLTAVGVGRAGNRTWFDVDVGAETLAVTTAAGWRVGARLDLERALKLGDELGGHLVSGHVDGIATVLSREDFDGMARFVLRAPAALSRYVAAKGSVAVDGVSLTVNAVEADDFTVLIIPHTLAATTLGDLRAGDSVNLEVDRMARHAERLFGSARAPGA